MIQVDDCVWKVKYNITPAGRIKNEVSKQNILYNKRRFG